MTSRCPTCGASDSTSPGSETLHLSVTAELKTIARHLQLMHSNEPPAAAELAYAQAVVSNTAAQIGSLDEEIVLLQTRLKQMEDERAALAIYHQRSLPILSPVRRMPPEILSEIFVCTQPLPADPAGPPMLQTRWRLSQVGRRWREIALSTPSLWSLVYVSGKRQADPLPMVQAQVQRARDLKIHFYGAQNGTGDATARIKLFTFLSEHSVRWEELFLRLTAELVPLLPPFRGRLPSLRRLSIIWHDERSQIGVDSVECFETAPFLEDVEFSSEFRYTPIPFPTDLLTSYRIQGSLESHQHILQMAPNIIEARVAITYGLDQPWPEPIGPTIDMLHLKRLYVTHVEILDYFRAPSLEEISINLNLVSKDENPVEHLDAFFLRSSCTPWRFCVEDLPDIGVTEEILKKYTSITSIGFEFISESDEAVYAHLSMLAKTPVAFPHLSEIRFGSNVFRSSPPFDYPFFLKMLQSRRSSISTAASIARKGPGPDPKTADALNALRQAGMSIFIAGADGTWHARQWTYKTPWVFLE